MADAYPSPEASPDTDTFSKRDKLLNGWWRNPNARSVSSFNVPTISSVHLSSESYPPTNRKRSRSMGSPHRQRRRWPPQPIVEEEVTSLAKEHAAAPLAAATRRSEVPADTRGTVDQMPILLETNPEILSNATEGPDDQEWRYVWVPTVNKDHKTKGRRRRSSDEEERQPHDIISKEKHLRSKSIHHRPSAELRFDGNLHPTTDPPSRDGRTTLRCPYSRSATRLDTSKLHASVAETFLSPDTYTSSSPFQEQRRRTDGQYTISNLPKEELTKKKQEESGDQGGHRRRRSGRVPFVLPGESKRDEDSNAHLAVRDGATDIKTLRKEASRTAERCSRRYDDASRSSGDAAKREDRSRSNVPPVSNRLRKKDSTPKDLDQERKQKGHETRSRQPSSRTSSFHEERQDVYNPSAAKVDSSELKNSHSRHRPRHLDLKSFESSRPSAGHSNDRQAPLTPPRSPTASSQLGHKQLPWTESLPSASGHLPAPGKWTGSGPDSRPTSRPGSSSGSRPSSPGVSSHATKQSTAQLDPLRPPKNETYPPGRGHRSRPTSRSSSPLFTEVVDSRSGVAHLDINAQSNVPSSLPSLAMPDSVRPGPRIDLISPGQTRRSASYSRAPEKRPRSPSTNTTSQARTPSPEVNAKPTRASKVTPLPPCPRSNYVRGHTDWYTLVDCDTFDICPSCYNSVIAPTRHRASFQPAPSRNPQSDVMCDFSLPWIRMAWIMTGKKGRTDLDILYAMARIAASIEPCPGVTGAARSWYTILHPDTHTPLSNFDICPCCVKSLETLLPPLQGAFIKSPHTGSPRTCDLRFSSRRFLGYIDRLEALAAKVEKTPITSPHPSRPTPDIASFARYARKRTSMRECSADAIEYGQGWHIMPSLPEFTVCEECYHDVIWPAVEAGSSLADRFSRRLQLTGPYERGDTCQLYSPRMRRAFAEAVKADDFEGLKWRVRERKEAERKVQARWAKLGPMRQSELLGTASGSGPWQADDETTKELARATQDWRVVE
ncbi:MAG: hypothetical protein M1833_007327 [Piccolia ochrophora]|nr:MAG: hypothetical protein M1833_007327 [Piccolia ochrophora]